jgi:hypothetical protein
LLKYFEEEIREHLSQKKCPFKGFGIEFRDSLIPLGEPEPPATSENS